MTKKVAILIDGGWFTTAIRQVTGQYPDAQQLYDYAISVKQSDEDLLRIFYYDSNPYEKTETNPISKVDLDYSKTGPYNARRRLFRELGQMELIALRRGEVKARGWELTQGYVDKLLRGNVAPPLAGDVKLALEQKGVDMRIGIDVSTLALKNLVDRIILVSGDTDMIPAMKLARREGVQVVLVQVGNRRPVAELIEDSDFMREIKVTRPAPPASSSATISG